MFLEYSGRIKRLDHIHPDLGKLTNLPFANFYFWVKIRGCNLSKVF